MIKKIVPLLAAKPKKLFLLDFSGALVTFFSLFVILRSFNSYFGMPETVLLYLSAAAGCLCVYSFVCFLFLQSKWAAFIRAVAIANLLYCLLTTVIVILFYQQLTLLGIIYFIGEIIIVSTLAFVELSVANRIGECKQF